MPDRKAALTASLGAGILAASLLPLTLAEPRNKEKKPTAQMPPIDAAAPTATHTATFALG